MLEVSQFELKEVKCKTGWKTDRHTYPFVGILNSLGGTGEIENERLRWNCLLYPQLEMVFTMVPIHWFSSKTNNHGFLIRRIVFWKRRNPWWNFKRWTDQLVRKCDLLKRSKYEFMAWLKFTWQSQRRNWFHNCESRRLEILTFAIWRMNN